MAKKNLIFIGIFIVIIIGISIAVSRLIDNIYSESDVNDNSSSGKKDTIEEEKIDFANNYDVDKDNVFRTITPEEAINILEGGTGILFIGFPKCPWCQRVVPVLNDTAKLANINQVYYLNIYDIRNENTSEYQRIVELLGDNLEIDEDTGKRRVYVPDVYGIKGGKITKHHLDVVESYDDSSRDLTIEEEAELKEIYKDIIKSVYEDCEC